MNSLPAIVKYVRFQRVTIRRAGTFAQHRSGGLAMSAESVRAFLASAAPDLEVVELPASSQTWVDICVVTRQGLVDSSDGRQ